MTHIQKITYSYRNVHEDLAIASANESVRCIYQEILKGVIELRYLTNHAFFHTFNRLIFMPHFRNGFTKTSILPYITPF